MDISESETLIGIELLNIGTSHETNKVLSCLSDRLSGNDFVSFDGLSNSMYVSYDMYFDKSKEKRRYWRTIMLENSVNVAIDVFHDNIPLGIEIQFPEKGNQGNISIIYSVLEKLPDTNLKL